MPDYTYTVVLQGATSDDKARRTFQLGTLADEATALAAAAAIRSALDAVTLANVRSETLSEVISADNQLPASGDCYEEAVVICHLNAPTEAEKLYTLRIPAPESLFLSDGETVDISNTDLIAFVAALAANVLLSDGEAINTASGSNGIKEGYKVSRSRSFK